MSVRDGYWYCEIVADEPQGISSFTHRVRCCCQLPWPQQLNNLALIYTRFDVFDQSSANRTNHPSSLEKLQYAIESVFTLTGEELSRMVMRKAMVVGTYLHWE